MPLLLHAASEQVLAGARDDALRRAGYDIARAHTIHDFERSLLTLRPAALLLDLPLIGATHEDIARLLAASPAPALVSGPPEVAAIASPPHRFLAQPSRPAAWLDAVRTLLATPSPGLRLDTATGLLRWHAHEAQLTPIETQLLSVLLAADGAIVPVEALVREVWGYASDAASAELVRAHVYQMRQRLAKAGLPPLVETLPRRGYRVVLPPEGAQDEGAGIDG